jgi:hypothetical protein
MLGGILVHPDSFTPMKPLLKVFAWLSTRDLNWSKVVHFSAGVMPMFSAFNMVPVPEFKSPSNYVELRGGKSGNYRFTLNSNVRVNLWLLAGITRIPPICPDGKRIEFSDADGRTWATLDGSGVLTIMSGYSWNGCSPKWWAFGRWWGTPDPVCTHLASLVHDVLYQFGNTDHFPINREACDMVFYNIMIACSANKDFAGTYYGAVCKLGCRFFKKNDCYSFFSSDPSIVS